MAEKKSWRDYSKDKTTESTTSEKTGSWRDYSSSTSTTSNKSGGWRDYSTVDTGSIVGSNVVNRVNSWLNSYNTYVSDYQKRYSGRKGNHEDAYVSDSADWLEKVKTQKGSLDTEAEEIISYLDQYKDYLDADWVSQVKSTLQSAKSTQSKILNASIKDSMYWDSFGTEDMVKEYGSAEKAYKANQLLGANSGKTTTELDEVLAGMEDGKEKELLTSYRATVNLDEMGKYDLVAGAKELEELERAAEEMATISNQYFFASNRSMYTEEEEKEITAKYNALVSKYGTPEELNANLNKKREYLEQAKYVQELNTWSAVTGNADFAQNSQYVSNVEYGALGKPSFTDDTYAYINNPTVEDKRVLGAGNITARSLINTENAIMKWDSLSRNVDSSYVKDALDYMKEDEVKIYNYYYATEGAEKANAYLDLLVNTLKERKYAEAFENAYKAGNEHPFWSSIASVATSIGSASEYLGDIVQYGADKIAGKDAKLDKNELAMTTNAIRGGASDTVDWKIGNWDAFDFLYNTTMSGIDSITSAAFGGAGGVVLGLSAAAQATNDAIDRGMSNGQAFWNGLFSGVFEGLFESVSIGNFNRLKEIAPNGVKDIIKNLGKSMLVNASEETLTEIANIAYDTLVNGEFANYTMEELKNGAWKKALGQVIEAGASGALMGVGMSAVGSTIGNTKANRKAKADYAGKTDTLINQGLQNDVNSKSYQLATKYQQKVQGKDGKKGKALTGQQIRNLLAANQDAITDKDMKKIQQAAENRLTELGQTGEVAKIAELATKYATGHELTRTEKSLLANSEYGSRVASELLPENVLTDLESSEWARGIGTESVNKLAYNINAIIEQMTNMDKPATYKSLEERVSEEEKLSVSKTGNATIRGTDTAIDLSKVEVAEFIKDKETGKVTDMVLNVDGKKVKASEIDYADGDQSYLFSAVKHIENITPGDATAFVRGYDSSSGLSAGEYLNGIDEAYTYGYHNYSEADMGAGKYAPKLSSEKAKGAYLMGQTTSKNSDTNKSEAIKRMRTAVEAEVEKAKADDKKAPKAKQMTITYRDENGKVVDGTDIRAGKQSGGVKMAQILHKLGLGTNFEFFTSYESKTLKDKKGNPARVYINENGVETAAPSGVYRLSDGTIRIDLNAYNGRQLTLNALAHELTHFIQQWSDEKYKVLADFLTKTYGETGMTMHQRVIREQARLEEIRGKAVSYNEAYDEVVANAMMKMFDDGKLVERLTELKATDEKLARKLWNRFKEIIAEFLGLYQEQSALFHDTADLMQMKDAFEQLQNMFAEALVEASENFRASLTPGVEGTAYTQSGEAIAHCTEDGSVQLSMHTYDTEGRDLFRGYLEKCVSSKQLTKTEMQEMLDGIEEIYNVCKEFKDKYAPFGTWSDAAVVRDTYGKPVFSVVTPNGEYKMNLDFSLVCKKRRTLDAVFNEMSKRGIIDDFELGQKSVVKINEIIRKYGFETACALCFVDAKRFRQASMADSFTKLYNELVTSLVPESKRGSIDYFNFSGYDTIKKADSGIDTWDSSELDFSHIDEVLKNYAKGTVEYKSAKYIKTHAEARKLLLRGDFMSSNGFDAVKSQNKTILSLYNSKKGTGGPKAAFGDVQYMNEIIKKAKTWTPAKAYDVGGVRIQSFSDYVPRMVFDYVQMVYDLAATKLPAHAYTKEALFAKQFGLTGIKINMSLIPAIAKDGIAPGLDANGNYVWAGESFDFETAKEIQNADGYTENCGTICVGVSDLHIRKLLADPNIRMVIPYHKSGLNPIVAHMNRIAELTDYTGSQNTLDRNGKKLAKDFEFDKALHKMGENGDPKAVIEEYLNWCDSNGYTPKFSQFRDNPNYYKLIEDFTLYDKNGNYVPQRGVQAVFPADSSAFGSMKSLIEAGLQEDAVIEGKRDKSLSSIVDEIQQSLPKTEAEIPETEVEQADRDLEAGERFSMHDTVEKTADLLAFHNITEKLLWDALKQKGLVMPSLAVTNKGLNEFGEISLLFDKSVIDPATNKENKLYGSDAWTPMQTSLKMNAKFDANKTVNAVNTMKDYIGSKYVSELLNITPKQFKEAIIKADGNIYEAYAHNIGVQAAYAMEKGIISRIPTNKDGTVNKELLQKQLDKTLDTDEGWRQYRRWLNNISDTVITSYDQASNEDILRHMKAQPTTAKPFKLSETGELTVPAKEYSSIKEMRRNKNRLSENAEESTKAVAAEFMEFAKKIGDTQQVVEAINAGFEGRYNIADIMKTFRNKGIELSSKEAGELQALYKKAVELPTQYFEAKPGGTVGLDKVNTAVVPESTSTELRQALEELGINVLDYNGTKESRVETMNSVKELRFASQETDAEGYDTTNLAWAIESGIITKSDQARFWEAIAEIQKLNYNSFARTKNGAFIIETENTMMFTDGDFKAPTLSKVILFPYGEFVDTSKERTMIRNEARTTGRTNQSTEIIEKLYGPGFVTEYYTPHYRSDGREIARGERTHSSGTASQSRGRGVRHSGTDGLQPGQKVNDFLADDKLKGNYTVSEISEMFDAWNSDPELADLSKKVFAKLQEMMNEQEKAYWATPYPIRFKSDAYLQKAYYITPNGIFEPSQTDGNYGITYNLDYFRKTSDQDKARVLLHEAIHACTVGAIKSTERRIPKYADPMEFTPDDSWSDAQKASLELIQVFSQVRVANERNEYGQKNVYEMVAEMSNPEFRAMLKKERLWNRIVDAIKRIFGIEQRTAYDAVSTALEKILELDMQKTNGEVYSTQETDNISNRDLLANAFETLSRSSIEYEMIQDYRKQIKLQNLLDEQLSDLNAEIHEMRFTKGKYDAKKLKALEEKAKRIAKDINKIDMTLLNMETAEPLRKLIQRERKIASEQTKAHVKEIQQNKKARAEQTELRHKIRKTVRDLDKILNRGNKKQNVKEDMQGFVSKALELADYLFTDHISNDDLIRKGITVRMTAREEALVKETQDILTQLYDNADSLTDEEFARLDAKRKANEDKLRDLLTSQRNERLNTPVYNLFNDLVTEYASLKNSNQEAVKGAYDPKVEEFLRSYLGENVDGTDSDRKTLLQNMRVADMTTEELWKLYNAYTMVLHSVRTANKLFVSGKLESLDKTVETIVSDFGKRKIPEGKVAIALRNLTNKFGWNYEKLYYALDRIGSEAFTELIMNIADSENTVMQDIIEAVAFRDKIVEDYGFNNWDVNKKIDKEFLDNTGKKFNLTLGQLMSLYAYSRREGAWDHIEYGGFVFGEKALTDPRPADSYKLSKAQCEAITNTLTKEQKAYVEDMQKFLSETMGAKGNEVSMLLYGIKMFGEKNYFPIHIAGQYKAQANESQAKAAAGFATMSNAGFTHAQNPNAKAPFVLEGFNEVWSDHVNEMSRYHGTVPALEDLRRVMNRSSYSDAYAESMSVKAMMENAFGQDAVDYFDNLYREANSGAIQDRLQRWPKKLLSLFRKNSVAYSLSVVIQQPSAMARAYAMIDKKYFGFKGFGALTSGIAKAVSSKWNPAYANAYNEMLKYAPGVTMAKEIGGFDTHTGTSIREYLLDTNKSFKQSMKTENLAGKGKALMGLVDDNAIANLPNVADKIAWIEIWNACKRETVAKHKDLATNSEEFMKIVGERFTEVIRATQVYDSMFSKSPMLKSKNLAVQYLVSFMNEPNTTANMVEKAVRDATKGDWKGGLRIAGAVTYSIIFNNVLKAMVYAMRDDDEDETYMEKYLSAVASGMMNDFNPLTYIPVVRDAWSKVQGYDLEMPYMAIVSDVIDAGKALAKLKDKDIENMTEEEIAELDKKMTDASWKLVGSIAAFFGIPVKNIYREIEGIIDHARIASKNAGMTTADSLWDKVTEEVFGSFVKEDKVDKLYDAIISGDTKYIERIKGTYKTEDAYQNAVRKALRENDSRIHDAAQARYDGNMEEYKRIFREIQKEGKFTFDDIMSAINSEVSAIKKGVEPEKATSDYTATGYVEAVAMGNTTEAQAMKEDIISTKVANGKTQEEAEKEFASAVATGIRDAYSSGLLDKAGAEKMLVEYADKDADEAASKVNYWAFCEEHSEYKDVLTESNVNDYQKFAEPAEIPLDVFVQYIEGTKGLGTIKDEWGDVDVTKREQVLEVIDSLPLTWEQKDALYLAAGYSENKIWDVPW